MIRWLKRRRQRPVPLTVREIELLAEANDEARRQAVSDPPLQVFSVTPPQTPLTSMPRFFLRRRGTTAARGPKGRTDHSRDAEAELGPNSSDGTQPTG